MKLRARYYVAPFMPPFGSGALGRTYEQTGGMSVVGNVVVRRKTSNDPEYNTLGTVHFGPHLPSSH